MSGDNFGVSAVAGYSNGDASSFQLPGSAVNDAFLDSSANGLIRRSVNSDHLGRYVFPVRNGIVQTPPAVSTEPGDLTAFRERLLPRAAAR